MRCIRSTTLFLFLSLLSIATALDRDCFYGQQCSNASDRPSAGVELENTYPKRGWRLMYVDM